MVGGFRYVKVCVVRSIFGETNVEVCLVIGICKKKRKVFLIYLDKLHGWFILFSIIISNISIREFNMSY